MVVMRTPKNILRHELIGLQCKVVKADNLSQIGIEGTVVNETRKILTLETPKGEKKLPKQGSVFRFYIGDQKADVPGDALIARPEDRIKKKIKEW